jgi:hypothetical protein
MKLKLVKFSNFKLLIVTKKNNYFTLVKKARIARIQNLRRRKEWNGYENHNYCIKLIMQCFN